MTTATVYIARRESHPMNPGRPSLSQLVHSFARERNPEAMQMAYHLREFVDTAASILEGRERQKLRPLARELAHRACPDCDNHFNRSLIRSACESAVPRMLRHIGTPDPIPAVRDAHPWDVRHRLEKALPGNAPEQAMQAAMDASWAWFDTNMASDGPSNAPVGTAFAIHASATIVGDNPAETFINVVRAALDRCRCPGRA